MCFVYKNWYTTVEVKAGKTSYISSSLTPTPQAIGSISVSSSPSGARIYMDASYQGRTPESITGVSPGSHTIKIKLDGYYTWERSDIQVTAGGTSYVSASLTSIPYPTTGTIAVSSSPSNAYIYMDGSYEDRTPKTITRVSPGSHTVELEHSGYYDWTNTVRVSAGSTSYVSPALNPNPSPTTGSIAVSSSPSGAGVYMDDVYKGITPLTITEVEPGTYTISVKLEGYEDWSTSEQVTAGSTESVLASLTSRSTPTPKTPTTVFSVIVALIISGIIADTKRRGRK